MALVQEKSDRITRRDPNAIEAAVAALAAKFGNRVVTSRAVREQHANTTSWIANEPPDAVVFPQATEDVQDIVRICAKLRVPVIPFGTGTSLEGHINAPYGGVSIDFRDMNRVLAVNAQDLDCVVEPGITRKQLNEHLRDQGLFFPLDPGADASLGGMAATRCSGTNAVRYGTMKDNVLALKVEAACNAAIATIQSGVPVARIELLDELQVKATNLYSKLALPEVPMLFVEFHGSPAGVAEQAERFGEIARDLAGGPFEWATKPEDRSRLWQARHDAYWAARGLRPGAQALATDVCVPISRLAECVTAAQREIAELGLVAPILGHVGDGNFHLSLLVDMSDAAEVKAAKTLCERLVEHALAMDGTCTGEHGVGQGKMKYLAGELGSPALAAMAAIKRALDPDDIMNPGKIVAI
jgi:D-lactate dehydrogenase (cytochrome)